jgi:nitrogen regulatory protein P-II 1
MKLIIAIVQPDKLDQVREALARAEVHRITVSRVAGHGDEVGEELYRGQKVVPDLLPKVRLEIACNDAFVEPCCNAILESARHASGTSGDGVIFILPLEECIRVSNGDRGSPAIG